MDMVQTVQGPKSVDVLGRTLMHEHIFVLDTEIKQTYPGDWNEEAEVRNAVQKLAEIKKRGIGSILDLTVLGLGRYIPRIERIASQTDVNILVATGLFTFNDIPQYFSNTVNSRRRDGTDLLTEMFVDDITTGIGESKVRAAVVKGCTDYPGVTPDIERLLRAVARAHLETGVPISTHTNGEHGQSQQDIFESEGVSLDRVVIGHSGDSTDLAYLRSILDRGSYIGMDRFGIDLVPFEARVETVAALCAQGYATQMVLSQDYFCYCDAMDYLKFDWPRHSYTHVSDDVIPALMARGVSQDDIDTMLIYNPRNIFSSQS